jgi:cytochrome bd ubiquinol oxidase subunit II
MELTTVWFTLIAVLWCGYFMLEGFDFGVGMLLPVLGRGETERRVLLNTIGPVWDGNEVWLIVAGAATFAAFPEWYATLFSGFYLPLLMILVALIIRGVAFEYRGKIDDARWRQRWDLCIIIGSVVPALLWGVAFGNIVRGVKIDASHEYVGNFFDLLNPYALLGGLTTLTLFALHGAVFLGLRTTSELRQRAIRLALRIAMVAIPVAAAFLLWTQLRDGSLASWLVTTVAAIALVAAVPFIRAGREGRAFVLTAAAIVLATASLFVTLFPNVMPSTLNPAYSLTVHNASSTPYTLKVMTWVAVIFTPIVLIYQGWTYWVFRRRIGVEHIPPATGLSARVRATK